MIYHPVKLIQMHSHELAKEPTTGSLSEVVDKATTTNSVKEEAWTQEQRKPA